ncbi:uncharacterized protein EV154DRAFT_477724 [Mucor mucedo]|uniref:uncharacterized protein n=1 Tax=Mucor mucedo TaxID=29922 RepID=UPI00222044FE|nr:uncharacterized protein EV154DRAFT_477724 [Mucor mucedo]KAI7894943.1 hypothetical protein EV154DRAFT_477724 [Mucor mucedo]
MYQQASLAPSVDPVDPIWIKSMIFPAMSAASTWVGSILVTAINGNYHFSIRASIKYDAASKKILEWGDECGIKNLTSKNHVNMVYVKNVFMELNNIYIRGENNGIFKHDKGDEILLHAMEVFLREAVKMYTCDDGGNARRCFFSLIIPTNWEYGIRQALIWPLFVRAGLVSEYDDKRRLMIFTKLEALVQFVKRNQPEERRSRYSVTPKLEIGREYILYNLHFTSKQLLVNFDLFSVYCSMNNVKTEDYVPKSLKSLCFNIPFNINVEKSIQRLLQVRGFDIQLTETKEILDILFVPNEDIAQDTDKHVRIQMSRPFEDVVNIWKLSNNTVKSIQSITMYDVHTDLFNLIQKEFSSNLKVLLEGATNKKRSTIRRVTWSESIWMAKSNAKIRLGLEARMIHGWLNMPLKHSCEYQTRHFIDKVFEPCYLAPYDLGFGHIDLTVTEIYSSIMNRPPTVMSRYNLKDTIISTMSRFEDSEPDCVVNINTSFESVNGSYSNQFVDACILFDNMCHMQPLNNYFVRMSMYQGPILCITNKMKIYMDSNFQEYFRLFSKYNNRWYRKKKTKQNKKITGSKTKKYNQIIFPCRLIAIITRRVKIFQESSLDPQPITYRPMMDALTAIGMKIKKCIYNHELDDFFEKPNTPEHCVFTDQKKYIRLFLMMYWGYINGQIACRLQEHPQENLEKLKIGYFISIEKPLMDYVYGSKENFQKILLGSGILQERNETIKARIVTPEEIEILSIVQQKFNLNLPLKSYFLLAQLHDTYIQLTLKQVVQISSSEKDASSILLDTRIIKIDSIDDTVCKYFWKHVKFNFTKNMSMSHNKTSRNCCDINSIQNHKNALAELKKYLMEMFSAATKLSDLDAFTRINICKTCGCNINVSIRNIIEKGLKPTLQDVAAIISSSAINGDLFGKYQAGYFFVTDNTLFTSENSPFSLIVHNMIQAAVEDCIESKRLDSQMFFVNEKLQRLLQPAISKRCHIYNSLMHGSLGRASPDTYAIKIIESLSNCRSSNVGLHLYGDGYKYNGKNYVGTKGNAMIILRKGQLIPHTGLVKHFRWLYRGRKKPFKQGVLFLRNTITYIAEGF